MFLDIIVFAAAGAIVGALVNFFAPRSGFRKAIAYSILGISTLIAFVVAVALGPNRGATGVDAIWFALGVYAVIRKEKPVVAGASSPYETSTLTQAPNSTTEQPNAEGNPSVSRDPSNRLQTLESLRDSGKLTQSEYETQRARIIKDI